MYLNDPRMYIVCMYFKNTIWKNVDENERGGTRLC